MKSRTRREGLGSESRNGTETANWERTISPNNTTFSPLTMKTPRGISEYEFSCITRSIVLSSTRFAEQHQMPKSKCIRDPPSGSSASTLLQGPNTRQNGHRTSVRPLISAHLAARRVSFLTKLKSTFQMRTQPRHNFIGLPSLTDR